MKLDRTLFKEVKALAGNGSREAKFALLRPTAIRDYAGPFIRLTTEE